MADQIDIPFKVDSQDKRCSKCRAIKPISDFGYTKTIRGKKLLRAQCRVCYNERRRLHYAKPDVHVEKRRKANEYNSLPDISEQRRAFRALPQTKAKDKQARDKYRSRPEVYLRIQAQKFAHRALPHIKAQALFVACRLRAQKKRIPFDLTEEWVTSKVGAGFCEVTGLPFDYARAANGWRYNPRSPSVDQIKAGAGYTIANCRVVITALNNAISQYGDDHFEEVAIAFLQARGFNVTTFTDSNSELTLSMGCLDCQR